ncbi:hypothetical protein [Sodalis-like endosymbiont of Proechinophthirus fluctus]|uniref:hypothetical protein n=1 Tax=Sodalis-like endosymbiont of Proechinophthirus fluctus TaxID=1462730 RepID=UPI00195E77C6|nr:hypothetical protein [Sodalis-like endosymbiont of Proechinophthirus fluctus]
MGLPLLWLQSIPFFLRSGVAAASNTKINSIHCALSGSYLKELVTDKTTRQRRD